MMSSDWEFKCGDVIVKFGESRIWVVKKVGVYDDYYVVCQMLRGGFLDGKLDEARTFNKSDCEKSFLKIGEYNWEKMKEMEQ